MVVGSQGGDCGLDPSGAQGEEEVPPRAATEMQGRRLEHLSGHQIRCMGINQVGLEVDLPMRSLNRLMGEPPPGKAAIPIIRGEELAKREEESRASIQFNWGEVNSSGERPIQGGGKLIRGDGTDDGRRLGRQKLGERRKKEIA